MNQQERVNFSVAFRDTASITASLSPPDEQTTRGEGRAGQGRGGEGGSCKSQSLRGDAMQSKGLDVKASPGKSQSSAVRQRAEGRVGGAAGAVLQHAALPGNPPRLTLTWRVSPDVEMEMLRSVPPPV